MADHPKVSILLPYYNASTSLPRAIESISAQTYPDFECLLIDNNSNDGSTQLAETYCKKDPRFVHISEKKQGIAFALNSGLEKAKGVFIARMDADDWCFPKRLQVQTALLNTHTEIGVVAGQAIHVPFNDENRGIQRYVEWSNCLLTSNDILLKRFVESPVIHPTVMWRKAISDKHGGYRHGNFPEDYELWLRWLANGIHFHKIDSPLVKWFDNPLRLTRIDRRYDDKAFFEIKSKYLAEHLKKINPHHPDVLIWGASKISRKRAELLQKFGIRISGYVDITNKRQLEEPVFYYENLPSPQNVFVLVYLKEETMRRKTMQFLESRNFIEGENYLLVS